jgi:hypothetical protein
LLFIFSSILDPSSIRSWRKIEYRNSSSDPNVPPKLFLPAAVVVGDSMYLFGGAVNIPDRFKNDNTLTNDLFR